MTTERIDIVVREDGSRVVKRNLGDIGKSADSAADSLETMKGILLTLAGAGVIAGLVRMADTYTTIQNRLRLVTTGTENLARVTKELQGIANSTRTDFEATTELYSRLASSSKELGVGQKQLLAFTKTLNQAIVLSGASAEEAAGGLRQLAQGMSAGTLRGDELNSVMENFPKVADIIAEGLGVTRGELRKLGAEGKITARDIIDAFAEAEKKIGEDFAKTVPTVSQSLTVLKNNLLTFVGEMDQSLGITANLSKFIILISENLETLIPILLGVGAAMAVAFAPGLIMAFAAQIRGLWALMLANPFVAVAAVVTGLLTTLYLLRDTIRLGIDETTTLGDLLRAAWESIGPAVQAAADMAAKFFQWLGVTSSGTFDQLLNDMVGYEHSSESTWLKLVRVVVQQFDMIGAVIRGTMMGVWAVISTAIDRSIKAFEALGQVASAAMNFDVEGTKAAIGNYAEVWKTGAEDIAGAFGKTFREQVQSQSENGLESVLDGWIKRAQEIGKQRDAAAKAAGDLNPGGKPALPPVDPDAAKKAARELERLKNALENVLDAADPVGAATRRLAEAQDVLNRAVKAGLIEQGKATEAYNNLKELMRDQLDPLGAVNRELEENTRLLTMNANARQIEADLLTFTEQLRRDGVKLTKEETDALRAKLTVEQELARIAQAKDSLRTQTRGSRDEEFSINTDALKQLMQEGGVSGGDKFSIINQMLGGSLDDTQAAFDAQMEQFAEYYTRVAELRAADVLNAQEASAAIQAIKRAELDANLARTEKALGAAAGLMQSNSKEAFRVGQAAAIGQAIVNTYTGATAAFQSAAAIPYVGWLLAPMAAAGAIAAGMAQVSAIRSQQMPGYRTGGSMTVGGSGGVDSQTVAFRATPGEQVSINTPAQANAMGRIAEALEQGGGRQRPVVNQSVTVVQTGKPDNKTPEQNARAMRKDTRKLLRVTL